MPRRKSSVAEVERADDGILRINDETFRRLSQADGGFLRDQAGAKRAEAFEKSLSVRQSLRLYRKAVIFSMFMSLAVVMEGTSLPGLHNASQPSDTDLY
jgi:MFS transporter, SP family, general alpha glucoside:H+ symporter